MTIKTTTINSNAAAKTDALTEHNAKVNAGLTRLPAMPGGARKAKALNACECGCGGLTGNRFVPGHDARLGGWIKRVERGLLVPNGNLGDQVQWIRANAGEGEAAAVVRELTTKYGAGIWEPAEAEPTGTDGQ